MDEGYIFSNEQRKFIFKDYYKYENVTKVQGQCRREFRPTSPMPLSIIRTKFGWCGLFIDDAVKD